MPRKKVLSKAENDIPPEVLEPPDDYEEEVTDEQIEEAKDALFHTIAASGVSKESGVMINKDLFELYKTMERYSQELAIHAVRYFKNNSIEDRKKLILKSIEVLKLNPPYWYEDHPDMPL